MFERRLAGYKRRAVFVPSFFPSQRPPPSGLLLITTPNTTPTTMLALKLTLLPGLLAGLAIAATLPSPELAKRQPRSDGRCGNVDGHVTWDCDRDDYCGASGPPGYPGSCDTKT